ncbi:MAG: helix-turn-helix transcriptional regulator [Lachnospiraceae bacterium]|nr:helix-turn-helix transcriptional regulator [Lachnospiraceae bacterium]MDD3797191.1 helix-turn-helix transcriptional regulator [Lachnospiraceae bacterium]
MTNHRKNQYRQLGLTIAYYRKLRGFTQLQLAETVNLSRTHISNLEAPNMPTSISLDKLFDISDALDIPIKTFFDFHDV